MAGAEGTDDSQSDVSSVGIIYSTSPHVKPFETSTDTLVGGGGNAANNKPHRRQLSAATCDMLDSDGLVTHVDVVQERLREMMLEHEAAIDRMTRMMTKLQKEALAAAEQQQQQRSVGEEGASSCNEDVKTDSTTSETPSIEIVDEKDAQPTLWVPDHAQATCMG